MAEQKFRLQTGIVFPDGTEQTTAYTGTEVSAGEPLFVVVNSSGESAYSSDGETWTQVASFIDGETDLSLDRVVVHRDFIIYIDDNDNLWTAEEPGVQPTLVTITSEAEGSYNWFDVQAGGDYVVAVGNFNPPGVDNNVPAFAYTTNGTSWTVGSIDPVYIAETGAEQFTSVDYDGTGWFITASDDGAEGAGQGAFYTTDLSIELSEPQFITFTGLDTPPSIDSVTWTGSNWFVLDEDDSIVGQRIYVSSGANPLSSTWTQYSLSSIADDYDYRLGVSDNGFYETAGGNGTFMIASGEGQILYTTDAGENWSGLVPKAYTCTIDSVLAGGSTLITGFTMTLGGTDWDGTNFNGIEKLTITGATPSDYNGARYVKTFGVPDSFLNRPNNNRNTNWIPGTYTVVVGEDFTVELEVDAEFYLIDSNITEPGTGVYGWGHEFTISGTELGGTDVLDDIILTAYSFSSAGKEYRVFTDSECTTALDSSGFTTFEGASAILNRGTFIDAVGYGLNKFLIGNDDEQLLTAPHDDLSVWTVVDNQDNNFNYWNDIGFNADFGGTGAVAGSYLTNGSATLVLNSDGSITFPDGSIQTTAYTGTATGPLYVVAGIDGNIIYSTNGTTFSAAFNTGMESIGTVAIGPNKIVYSGLDVNADSDIPGLYSTSSPTTQPTLIPSTSGNGDYYLAQVKYFPSATPPWVAVGLSTSTTPTEPIILHSTDAETWTETRVNATDLSTFFTDDAVDLRFVDIQYQGSGWLIAADRNNDGGAKGGGLWWTTDITQELTTSSNFINIDTNFKAVESFASSFYSRWHAFGADGSWWTYNSEGNPTDPEIWDGSGGPGDLAGVIQSETNLSGQTFEEAASGLSNYTDAEAGQLYVWVTSSGNGHIVWWPNIPAGPFVSIPAPYTVTVEDFTQSATSSIVITEGGAGYEIPGERFTITGSSVSDYNGTYYIDDSYNVFTDAELTVPFDTSGFDPFTGTATLTWSHGQYIDALAVANGYIYAANDDEEVYRGELNSEDGINWTKVDDKNDSLAFWNTIGFYDEFSGSSSNTISTGNITFSGNQIRGSQTADYFGLIELVPSTSATGEFSNLNFLDYGQYVRIYPTNEFDTPHIHIAAGEGTNGEGDLFIGDDLKYLSVRNSGYVVIRSNDYNTDTGYSWTFDNDGSLTIPSQISATEGQALRLFTTDAEIHLMKNPTTDIGIGLQTSGNNVEITTSGNSWQFGEDGSLVTPGNIEFPNGGYIEDSEGFFLATDNSFQIQTNKTAGQIDFTFGSNGTLTLPGAVVNSTVSKDGADINGNDVLFEVTAVDGGVVTEITVTNSPNPAWISGTSGLALDDIDFSVSFDGVGNASVTVNNGGTGHSIGETFVLFPAAVGGTTPTPTALDLDKTVNILSTGGNYSLADGTEGQIMYFVPASGLTSDVYVIIANARIMGEGPVEETDYSWTPFFGESLVPTTIAMAIFADGAWCLRGGASD
jgi:hypothetical protein